MPIRCAVGARPCAPYLASVDALARRRERRLVLRLEDDVHDLEDRAIANLVRLDAAVLRVALREHARRAGRDHVGRRRADHGAPVVRSIGCGQWSRQ